jgi:hypothetical protein
MENIAKLIACDLLALGRRPKRPNYESENRPIGDNPMRILCSLLAALSLALASPAAATIGTMAGSSALYQPRSSDALPAKNYKEKWKGGGCKYEYKANKKGFKEKYQCK